MAADACEAARCEASDAATEAWLATWARCLLIRGCEALLKIRLRTEGLHTGCSLAGLVCELSRRCCCCKSCEQIVTLAVQQHCMMVCLASLQ